MSRKPDPTDKHVGRRVRMRRKMLKMSQTTLARAVGLTFQQIQKYELGTNRMGSSRLAQVAEVLQVPISFFFPSDKKQPDYVSEFLTTTEGLALAEAFAGIKRESVRRNVVKLVEAIRRSLVEVTGGR